MTNPFYDQNNLEDDWWPDTPVEHDIDTAAGCLALMILAAVGLAGWAVTVAVVSLVFRLVTR